jgi:hypothetical protein
MPRRDPGLRTTTPVTSIPSTSGCSTASGRGRDHRAGGTASVRARYDPGRRPLEADSHSWEAVVVVPHRPATPTFRLRTFMAGPCRSRPGLCQWGSSSHGQFGRPQRFLFDARLVGRWRRLLQLQQGLRHGRRRLGLGPRGTRRRRERTCEQHGAAHALNPNPARFDPTSVALLTAAGSAPSPPARTTRSGSIRTISS